ncbi:mechanosensitive ion channel family protein [Pseudosulfitobacter koreensis]|uniref:Small-conductance mechanosensitive channel n=1 Tax=Pseudosulfitobacter koreensis TaxID=2968472 RepID=A0ABT1Z3V4_9RHOB|nr:mechanosensitive ion channel family protein [Pseudosulfitobacter koreense]MCR8827796.1 mechanosensitive ion channel [Pseudosulfitobacter koreense]
MSALRHVLTALALALVLWSPAAHAQTQPQGEITVEDSAQQDAAIAVRIRDILSELQGYSNVTVTVSSGIVTLRGTTLDAAAAIRLNDLVGRVQGVVAIENEVLETTDVAERLNPAYERFKGRVLQALAMVPLLGVAISVFALVVLLGVLLARAKYPWDRIAPNAFIADIYRQLVRLFFVVAGIVIALDVLNATALLGTVLGAAGLVGLAIGFAVRDTVENFIASIMLSFRQPFRPNDTVEIEGDVGKVISLTSRATILLSFDGNHIRIPNATVFKSRIINYTRNTERRFVFDVGVATSTDLAAAKRLALDTVTALPFVLTTPAPAIWIETIGDSTISIRVTGWIDQHETGFALARGEAIRHVLIAFDTAGIQMPEPTFRVVSHADRAAATPEVSPTIREVETQDVQSTQNAELEKIVDQERAERADKDLLTREAREE